MLLLNIPVAHDRLVLSRDKKHEDNSSAAVGDAAVKTSPGGTGSISTGCPALCPCAGDALWESLRHLAKREKFFISCAKSLLGTDGQAAALLHHGGVACWRCWAQLLSPERGLGSAGSVSTSVNSQWLLASALCSSSSGQPCSLAVTTLSVKHFCISLWATAAPEGPTVGTGVSVAPAAPRWKPPAKLVIFPFPWSLLQTQ